MECEGHSHDHEHADEAGASLRPEIDLPSVYCLNESAPNSGRSILKPHDERFTTTPSLLSQYDPDDDPELLLHVPFTEGVTIRTVTIKGLSRNEGGGDDGNEGTAAPKTIKIFANRQDLDFETARDLEPQATIDLLPPEHGEEYGEGTIDYPLRPAGRFQGVSSVTLYFGDNYGPGEEEDRLQTEITFVGFKGKGMKVKRGAVECVYETRGMKKDHEVPDEMGGRSFV